MLLLAACSDGGRDQVPPVTGNEARALDDAAEMLNMDRLGSPGDARHEAGEQGRARQDKKPDEQH